MICFGSSSSNLGYSIHSLNKLFENTLTSNQSSHMWAFLFLTCILYLYFANSSSSIFRLFLAGRWESSLKCSNFADWWPGCRFYVRFVFLFLRLPHRRKNTFLRPLLSFIRFQAGGIHYLTLELRTGCHFCNFFLIHLSSIEITMFWKSLAHSELALYWPKLETGIRPHKS